MKKYNLVFMGDSITAGVYSDGKLDYNRKGYPDIIKDEFIKQNKLNSFYNIAVPGFSAKETSHMLNSKLTYNENIAFNITPERSYKKANYKKHNSAKLLKNDVTIDEIIKKADIITMTLGSNDVIYYLNDHAIDLKDNFNLKEIIDKKEEKTLSQVILQGIFTNFKNVLNYIYELNEDVEINLIGTYTPHKSGVLNKMLYKNINILEEELVKELTKEYKNIKYMKIIKEIYEKREEYLNNPLNIHLNYEGYKFIANKYLDEIVQDKIK